ncbi:hypothetical protein JOD54_006467 [Actinokineospora baliensis]|uniref:hypothetical protein n=1 Tax=Actinokineospora baliensis TaxID=547056 RepID=UPI001956FBF7|nr:hypothetical protein [Actinokineospora baliensis]MBM7776263.1 hypothetical protein [Actinokineospora baliensis]
MEQLQIFTEELCCEYAWRDAGTAGWLMLLTGYIEYDMGNYRQAELDRAAGFRVGEEIGYGDRRVGV